MKAISLVGKRFGRLHVLGFGQLRHGRRVWECKCDCGNSYLASRHQLTSGMSVSCGCWKAERIAILRKTHGHTSIEKKNGRSYSPTYMTWISMRDRCTNPKSKAWKRYGALGISVCDRWLNSFECFLSDVGERPNGFSLDRIISTGPYELGNVRWADPSQQARNTKRTCRITLCGREIPLREACERYGVNPGSLDTIACSKRLSKTEVFYRLLEKAMIIQETRRGLTHG